MVPCAALVAARVAADASLVSSPDETPPERQEVKDDMVDAADSAPFFIAVLGKRRLLRLHKAGRCPASPSELRETIPLWSLDGAEYHSHASTAGAKGRNPSRLAAAAAAAANPVQKVVSVQKR
eukprot:s1903_g14.t1